MCVSTTIRVKRIAVLNVSNYLSVSRQFYLILYFRSPMCLHNKIWPNPWIQIVVKYMKKIDNQLLLSLLTVFEITTNLICNYKWKSHNSFQRLKYKICIYASDIYLENMTKIYGKCFPNRVNDYFIKICWRNKILSKIGSSYNILVV